MPWTIPNTVKRWNMQIGKPLFQTNWVLRVLSKVSMNKFRLTNTLPEKIL